MRARENDDFYQAIEALKASVPASERSYEPDERRWRVLCNEANEQALCAIFANGQHCLTSVKNQLRMF